MFATGDDFSVRLKASGQSLTSSRRLVFDSLRLHGPLTMNELVSLCSPTINRATIYRVIKLFEKLDIVNRIQIGWKYKLELSEQFNAHHHHLTCLNCSKIIDTEPLESVEQAIKELAKNHNFELKSHQLDIVGICSDCQKKDPGNKSPDL